jgi:hypothetical protein
MARQVERAERLPAIEDEVVDAGFDKFIVSTQAGTSTWRSVVLMPEEAGEEPPGMATFDLDPREPCVAHAAAAAEPKSASRHQVALPDLSIRI